MQIHRNIKRELVLTKAELYACIAKVFDLPTEVQLIEVQDVFTDTVTITVTSTEQAEMTI